MKKSRVITAGFFMLLSANLIAQTGKYGTDSLQCLGSLSVMNEYAKMELYEEAYDSWKYCFNNCPVASQNIYIIGADILHYKIEHTNETNDKNHLIDTLMLLYERRISNFGQEGFVSGRQGLDLLKYRSSELKTAYELLKKSFDLEKEHTEATVLGYLLQVAANLYKNKGIQSSELLTLYFRISESITRNTSLHPSKYTSFANSLNKIIINSGIADCGMLEEFLLPKLAQNKNNTELLRTIISLTNNTDCAGSQINITASEMLFNAEPSAETALYLAQSFVSIKNYTRANDYYKQAVEIETDTSRKASLLCQMSLVSQQQNKLQEARDFAREALDMKSDLGEAFIAIGLTYAASANACGNNSFENAAVYWIAVDQFIKAKEADPTVSEKANELIEQYTPFFPDNETAFFYGYQDGDLYTVECWIHEKTKVRTRKLQ